MTIIVALIVFATTIKAQTPLIQVESQHLKNRNTEFYGPLAEMPSSERIKPNNSINFNAALKFNGTNEYIRINQEIPDLNQATIFTVFVPSENAEETFDIWRIQTENSSYKMTSQQADNSGSLLSYGGIQNGQPAIHCYTQHFNAKAAEYTDGSTYISFGKGQQIDNNYFNGRFAELIVFNKILTRSYKNKIFSSLAIKYGVTLLDGQNYTSSDDILIWDAKKDSIYSNNIAGIGRDDKQNLYQKQSTSSNNPNFLIIGVDSINLTNNLNSGTLQDQYFMLWGDNRKALNQNESASIDAINVLERKWLMKVTGNEEDDVFTQIKLDGSGIDIDSLNSLILVIDESGTGNFEVDDTRFVYPTNVSEDGLFTYDKVKWDQNGSGKDIFSFKIDNRPQNFMEDALIESDGNVNLFGVYPSISTDGNYSIYIQLEKIEPIYIKVFDIAGKLISDTKLRDQNVYLLDGIPIKTAGIYNVSLYTKFEKFTKKIVVEN